MQEIATRGAGPILPILEGAAERSQGPKAPTSMAPEDAQAFVNFIVVVYRGAGQVESCTVRREALPGSRHDEGGDTRPTWTTASQCSLKTVIKLPDGRLVRIKQCLPDYGVSIAPMHMHMVVGEARGRFDSLFTMSEQRVGWMGLDHTGKRCAAFVMFGTHVELRVVTSSMEEEELVEMCKRLEPVSVASSRQLALIPFAKLSYWGRWKHSYRQTMQTQVPSSLLKVPWPDAHAGPQTWTDDISVAERWLGFPPGGDRGPTVMKVLGGAGWRPDSVCVLGGENGGVGAGPQPDEVLLVCFPQNGPRHKMLWLRSMKKREVWCVHEPLGTDVEYLSEWDKNAASCHPCDITHVNVPGSNALAVTWVDRRYGPFEGAFWAADRVFMLQVTACDQGSGKDMSVEFRQFARSIAKAVVG